MRYIYLIIIFFACSCSQKQQNNKIDSTPEKNFKKPSKEKEAKLVDVKWEQVDSYMFSDSIAKKIAYNSIFKSYIEMCHIDSLIFSIVIKPDLGRYYNTALACGNNIDLIIKEGFELIDTFSIDNEHLYKLKYKNSEIYHTGTRIAYSHILDSNLELNFGFHIGMTKQEFLDKIMQGKKIPNMDSLKVFELSEILDENTQSYYFENDTLIASVTDVHDHWMIAELNVEKWPGYNKWYRKLRFDE